LTDTATEFERLLERRDLAAYRVAAALQLVIHFLEAQDYDGMSVQLRYALDDFQAADQRITEFKMIRPKTARLQLIPLSYESPRQQILRCGGWRCQSCRTMSNLEVHHKEFRSHSGADSEENLITLCAPCHAAVHRS
jgi:hypothetical protein